MNRGGWEGLDMSTIWLGCCLGSHALKWPVGVVFIATNQIVVVGEGCWRWAHRTVRCVTGHCPVCRHVSQPLGLGAGQPLEALSSCGTEQSGAAPDWYCSLSGASLTLRSALSRTVLHCSTVSATFAVDRCASSRCSAGTPDSPVAHRTAYRTVRWIIAECASRNPRVAGLRLYGPGATDTIRCARPQHTRFLCSFEFDP
jgi:hypothetical protein